MVMKVSKICALIVTILVFAAMSCSAFAAEDLNGKTLRLALNSTFVPFEFITEDGDFDGFDIDIVNRLAEKLGFNMEISDMIFDGLIGALVSGRADFVISGISPTTERLKVVDATISYFYPTIAIITQQGNNFPTPESLSGHKVGTSFGNTYEAQARAWPGVEVVALNTMTDVLQELLSSRIDAAVMDGCQSAVFTKMYPDKLKFTLLPIELNIEDSFAVLFPKNSPYREPINAALTEMLKNGEIDTLIEKWFGADYLANYREEMKQAGLSY